MLDPEDDSTEAPSTKATDASRTPVHDAWSKWTSDPANNAALLQFGIAMLQPRAPGQSGVGQFANAIGSGGEAAGRVTTNQNAEDLAASQEEDRKATTAAKTSNAASTAATAAAYGRSVDNAIANPKGTTSSLRAQAALQKWKMSKDINDVDLSLNNGVSTDPVVQYIHRRHPEVRTKNDILGNQALEREALGFINQGLGGGPSVDEEGNPTTAEPSAPAAPATRTIYKNGKPYSWDGVNPPVPQ